MEFEDIQNWISKVDPSYGIGEPEEELDVTEDEKGEQRCRLKKTNDLILLGQFVTHSDRLGSSDGPKAMGHIVTKDAFYLGLGGAIINPGHFYINPLQTWNALEEMMGKMGENYAKMALSPSNSSMPWDGHLTPGFFVVAKFQNEYHRAQIIEVLGLGKYKVRLIDYGEEIIVPITEIRYLLRKFWEMVRPQAIRCTVKLFFFGEKTWTPKETDKFRKEIFNKTLALHFKRGIRISEDEMEWEVFVHIYDEDSKKIVKFHVERDIIDPDSWELTDRNISPKISLFV